MIKINIKTQNQNYTKLSVFDFDRTLFKSPEKPDNHKGNWWIEKKSLSTNLIGEIPKDSMWNMDTVRQAQEELQNKNTYCVMMTGRIGRTFEEIINNLLKQKNLNFKKAYFNSFGQDSSDYKIKEIKKILKKYPSIKNIEMWDDDREDISIYTKEFASKYNFYINRI